MMVCIDDINGLIVLGSEKRVSAYRAKTAAEYAKNKNIPIIAAGKRSPFSRRYYTEAQIIEQELLARGIPRRLIEKETESRNTYDNFRNSAGLISKLGIKNLGVVASSSNMARALRHGKKALNEQGVNCNLYPIYPSHSLRDINGLAVEASILMYELIRLFADSFSLREFIKVRKD